MRYVIYDLESTGLDVTKDRIVELAAMCVTTGKQFHQYIRPHSRKILGTEFHGLTQESLKEKDAKGTKSVLNSFKTWISTLEPDLNKVCLVAHNNFGYDQLLLENEFKRAYLPVLECKYADTYLFFREGNCFSSHKLGNIYKTLFKEELPGAHTAMGDVVGLKRCLERFPDCWTNMEYYTRDDSLTADPSEFDWSFILNGTANDTLCLYGYTNMQKILDGYMKYGNKINTIIDNCMDKWSAKRFQQQAEHLLFIQHGKFVHSYSTRSG